MAEKTNKLDSRFRLIGAFWTPDSSDEKPETGTLAADAHHITLSTAPVYKELKSEDIKVLFDSMQTRTTETIETVHGRTAEGDCTLFGLFETEYPGFSDMRVNKSVAAAVYRVSVCLMGMHVAGFDDRCLDSARYTFRKWHQWLPRYVTETWEKDAVVIRVPTKPLEMACTQFENQPIEVKMKLIPLLSTDEDTGGKMKLDPATFVSNVVFMRNYYTHAGGPQRRNKTPLEFRDLFFLNQKMRALLRGVMLLRLQLPENILLGPLVRDATRWR